MLNKIWQYIKGLFQQLLIIFPLFPKENSSRRTSVAPPRPTRTDAEYEAIFMQLLEEVDRGTSSGNVAGFLMVKNVKEKELAVWLRQFGERLLGIENPSVTSLQELARRLVLLSEIRGGELGGVAGELGRGILAKFPLPIVEEDWRGKVIEAVFVGDGLGGEVNRKGAEDAEGNEEVNQEGYVWFYLGSAQYLTGDFEGAITSYDKAIEFNSDNHEAWYNRGVALQNLGRNEEAIASYDKAIDFKPDYHEAWSNRGLALDDLGRYEDAIVSYDQAIDFKPDFHEAWHNRGVALKNLGRYEDAIASYDQAIDFKPDDHEAWINRGLALDDLGRYEDAIASYDQAIDFKPDYHEAWNNRGLALGNLGRYEDAIASYDQAIEIKPDKHEAWNNRGLALDDLGRYEDAIASYDKAIDFKPDLHEAWINRGSAAGSIDSYFYALSPTAITLQNPTLNQRGYQGKLASFQVGLKYVQKDKQPQGWGRLHWQIGKTYYFRWLSNRRSFYELSTAAIDSYNQALETLTKDAFPEEHLDVLRDLIKVYISVGQTDKATQLQRDATDLLRRLIAETNDPAKREKWDRKLTIFYQLTVDIFVQSWELIKAIETAEEGKNTCLYWLFSDDNSPKYPQIQQLLNPATAAIYWHLSDYALHTFIIKSGESQPIVIEPPPLSKGRVGEGYSIATPVDEFEEWMKKWNQEYGKGKGEKQEGGAQTWRDNLPETLKNLSKILNIAAIEEEVRGIKNLILIPHRDLHRFPIHALFGDEFIISYLPSAKIGINLLKANHLDNKPQTSPINFNPNASPQPIAKTVLSLENPHSTFKEGDREKRFPSLPAADIESEMICQMFANSTRVGENEATRDRVITELQQPHNILHFTGHGSYEFFDPKKSALFLSGSDRLTVQEIIGIDLSNYELVCLSACETAVTGNQTIVTEYVGLVSAFMGAKAKYVLSTLWPVESAASALLIVYFYQQLQAGHREATALAIAQKWLRDATREDLAAWYQAEIDKNPRPTLRRFFSSNKDAIAIIELNQPYQHPYYWAAFTLTGL